MGLYSLYDMEVKILSFRRGSEVSQVKEMRDS